jgi:hypothetical protein
MPEERDTGPVVYVDRSDVREGVWEELEAGIRALVAFVDRHQPQMVSYGVYLDEDARRMTVVSVHPDAASLERHIEVGGPEFAKLGSFIELREIEVFGRLSASALERVREKAAALGERGVVRMHELFSGFDRIAVPDPRSAST